MSKIGRSRNYETISQDRSKRRLLGTKAVEEQERFLNGSAFLPPIGSVSAVTNDIVSSARLSRRAQDRLVEYKIVSSRARYPFGLILSARE